MELNLHAFDNHNHQEVTPTTPDRMETGNRILHRYNATVANIFNNPNANLENSIEIFNGAKRRLRDDLGPVKKKARLK